MNGKPTFWEYVLRCEGNVVKSRDGHYYAYQETAPPDIRVGKAFSIVFLLMIIIPVTCLILNIFTNIWKNLFADVIAALLLTFMIILCVYERKTYRKLDFMEIREGSDGYRDVVAWNFRHVKLPLGLFFLTLFVVAALANGFWVMSIKSVIDDKAELAAVEMTGGQLQEDTIVLGYQPSPDSDAVLKFAVETRCTPHYIAWMLDGKKLKPQMMRHLEFGWIWEEDYFIQRCYADIPLNDVKDGSVLELTCGSLHREWTIVFSGE